MQVAYSRVYVHNVRMLEFHVFLGIGWVCMAEFNHAAVNIKLPACIVKICSRWRRLTAPVQQVIKDLSNLSKDLCKSLLGLTSRIPLRCSVVQCGLSYFCLSISLLLPEVIELQVTAR